MFDMAIDDVADATMEEADAVMEVAREEEENKTKNIRQSLVSPWRSSKRITIYTTINSIIKQLES